MQVQFRLSVIKFLLDLDLSLVIKFPSLCYFRFEFAVNFQQLSTLVHIAKLLILVRTTIQSSSDRILNCNYFPFAELLLIRVPNSLSFDFKVLSLCQIQRQIVLETVKALLSILQNSLYLFSVHSLVFCFVLATQQ